MDGLGVQGSGFKVRGSKFKVQGSRFGVRGLGVTGCKLWVMGYGINILKKKGISREIGRSRPASRARYERAGGGQAQDAASGP